MRQKRRPPAGRNRGAVYDFVADELSEFPGTATNLMSSLALPYLLNILMLAPVGPLTLWGGRRGLERVFQGRFAESEGVRTILGSLWTAILCVSILGLYRPTTMAPLLVVQVIYKSLWLATFVAPRLASGRAAEVPPGVAISFAMIVATYPLVIPWRELFG